VVNRLLTGKAAGGVEAVSIWHGTLQPGGFAEPHVHEGSVQIYVGLTGWLDVETPSGAVVLGSGDAVILEENERHSIRNSHAEREATLLVVSAPALR
jgi:mannose-6-phosphate isomerase-like protein (cupin superfamily)